MSQWKILISLASIIGLCVILGNKGVLAEPEGNIGRYQLVKTGDGYPRVFDTATGRLYIIQETQHTVIDPILGTVATGKTKLFKEAAKAKSHIDLTSKLSTAKSILQALKNNDKESFRKCVTKRILDKHKADFDRWFHVWKKDCEKMSPEKFASGVRIIEEDGLWKLNEN